MHDCYRRYGPALLRKACRVLQNPDDAADIVQGLFTDLLRRPPPRLDLPYLYRAITHRCLNWLRDMQNRQRLISAAAQARHGWVRRGDEALLDSSFLLRLLQQLDEECHEVLIYYYHDCMSQNEIGEIMGLSRKTVAKRVQHICAVAATLREERRGGVYPCSKSA